MSKDDAEKEALIYAMGPWSAELYLDFGAVAFE